MFYMQSYSIAPEPKTLELRINDHDPVRLASNTTKDLIAMGVEKTVALVTKRIWITRTEPGASRLASQLLESGVPTHHCSSL